MAGQHNFWAYFADTLHWPLAHVPGPLQALLRGLGAHMDTSRDDMAYVRAQFFPSLCEGGILPLHGDSRGIIRHQSETDAQFRARVSHAWRWHMLGGKTLGLPEILAFYGYPVARIENTADTIPARWAEFQLELREPASQIEQDLILHQMDTLLWLTNEYKPARSRLARIYHAGYDVRPLILDRHFGLDRNFLDGESGIYYPEDDVVVSFGYRIRSQALPADRTPWAAWLEQCACLVDYLTRPQLDRFRLDVPLLQPPTLNAAHIEAAEIEAVDHGHDLSRHRSVARAVSRSQLDVDWSYLDGVNSRLDRPHVVRVENPWLLDVYRLDADIRRVVMPIHELYHELILHAANARAGTAPVCRFAEAFGGEIFFDLHNPQHRGPQLDRMLLDSPARERFDLADGRLQADFVPEPRRWFDSAAPSREISRSQFALDASRLDEEGRFDGPCIVKIANPVQLDRYRLDASIGKSTQPLPAIGVHTVGSTVLHAVAAPQWAELEHRPGAVLPTGRQAQSQGMERISVTQGKGPFQARTQVAKTDSTRLDVAWLHGNPADALPSLLMGQVAALWAKGAELLPQASGREQQNLEHQQRPELPARTRIFEYMISGAGPEMRVPSLAGLECLGIYSHGELLGQALCAGLEGCALSDAERVRPSLWTSGWIERPWLKHFAYLKPYINTEVVP